MKRGIVCLAWAMIAIALMACKKPGPQPELIKEFPANSLEGVLTQAVVELDPRGSSDGKGSFKISANQAGTMPLFETGDLDLENARLIYQAKLRSEKLEGNAYLEMWCHFPGKGEFFARGLPDQIRGDTGWVSAETTFFLKAGENPDNVKLNLVIEGKGTVWIDQIKLL